MPELTEQQQAALPVLEWLLNPSDDSRRTGRTTVIALACIRLAIAYPGRWVYVPDHCSMRDHRFIQYAFMEAAENLGVRDLFEIRRGRELSIRVPPGERLSSNVEAMSRISFPTREDLDNTNLQEVVADNPHLKSKEALSIDMPRTKTIWDHLTS